MKYFNTFILIIEKQNNVYACASFMFGFLFCDNLREAKKIFQYQNIKINIKYWKFDGRMSKSFQYFVYKCKKACIVCVVYVLFFIQYVTTKWWFNLLKLHLFARILLFFISFILIFWRKTICFLFLLTCFINLYRN